METWIIYALLSILLSGLFSFGQKVSSVRGYSGQKITTTILLGQLMTAFIFWGMGGFSFLDFHKIAIFSALTGVLYSTVNISRIISLKYIDSSIYFPIYKAVGPTIVVAAGVFFFKDVLQILDWVGIVMGITVPLLLISSSERHRQTNLFKGMSYLMVGVLMAAFTAFISKYVATTGADIFLFILIQSVAGIFWLLITGEYYKKIKGENVIDVSIIDMLKLGLPIGVINAIAAFCVLKAYETGPISIVYTINSFYILVPIILSIIIYKEHINLRKGVAIFLSLAAITFFQF